MKLEPTGYAGTVANYSKCYKEKAWSVVRH